MIALEQINEYVSLVSGLGLPLCGWIWWSAKRIFATREELAHAQAENAALRARLDTLEENMPTGDTMLAIQLSQQEIRGDIKALYTAMDGLRTSMEAMSNNTHMLMEFHLGERKS